MNNTDQIIDKLLGMRLTKFQFGFVSGLRGHQHPSDEQRAMLARVVSRYENVIDYIKPANNDQTERHHNEHTTTPNAR